MAPPVGLEPTTHGLTVRRSTDWAKGECLCWHYLSSRAVTRQVLSALVSLTSVFGMGTGGPSQQSIPTHMDGSSPSFIVKSLPASNRFILAHPVLPVNCFLPELLVTRTGFEPMLKAWEASVLTTWPTGHLVRLQGLEPGTHWLRVSCSTNWAKGAVLAVSIHPENWTLFLIYCNHNPAHWACALVKLSAY